MHRLYLAKHEPEAGDKPIVKEWLYRKIFNEDFNLGFGYPRSDTCQMCDGLRMEDIHGDHRYFVNSGFVVLEMIRCAHKFSL